LKRVKKPMGYVAQLGAEMPAGLWIWFSHMSVGCGDFKPGAFLA
jgi:hypothetical protein